MKNIVWQQSDGNFGVEAPVDKEVWISREQLKNGEPGEFVTFTDSKEYAAHRKTLFAFDQEGKKVPLIPADWKIIAYDVDPAKILEIEDYRAAWEGDDKGGVRVNLEKAKEVFISRVRAARAQKFIDLGFPNKLHPELEAGILTDETRGKLQALRDLPQKLDLAKIKTLKALREAMPVELS